MGEKPVASAFVFGGAYLFARVSVSLLAHRRIEWFDGVVVTVGIGVASGLYSFWRYRAKRPS